MPSKGQIGSAHVSATKSDDLVLGGVSQVSGLTTNLDALSQAVSVVSQALSAETSARVAAVNTVSNTVSVLAQAHSVLSTALRGVSTYTSATQGEFGLHIAEARISADGTQVVYSLPAISAAVAGKRYHVVKVDATDANVRIIPTGTDTIEGASRHDIGIDQWDDAVYVADGVGDWSKEHAQSEIKVALAAATSADAHAATADAHAATASAAATSVDSRVNTLSAAVTSVDTHAATASAAATSVNARVTSILAGVVPWLSCQRTLLSANATGISAAALTKVPGLSATVANGGFYMFEANLMHYVSNATANAYGLGLSVPVLTKAGFLWRTGISAVAAGGPAATSAIEARGYMNQAGTNSIIISAVASTQTNYTHIKGTFRAGADGTINLKARVSATTAPVVLLAGSHIICYRLG